VKTPAPQRAAGRRKLAAAGQALPDGTAPVPDLAYLKKAIRAKGRVDPAKWPALKKLIVKRARQLGATSAPGVKGSWAFQGAGSPAGLQLAGPGGWSHGWVRDAGAAATGGSRNWAFERNGGTEQHMAAAHPGTAAAAHIAAHLGNPAGQGHTHPFLARLHRVMTAPMPSGESDVTVIKPGGDFAGARAALELTGPGGWSHGWVRDRAAAPKMLRAPGKMDPASVIAVGGGRKNWATEASQMPGAAARENHPAVAARMRQITPRRLLQAQMDETRISSGLAPLHPELAQIWPHIYGKAKGVTAPLPVPKAPRVRHDPKSVTGLSGPQVDYVKAAVRQSIGRAQGYQFSAGTGKTGKAIEMTTTTTRRRVPVVRGAADIQLRRTAPGVISAMHKSSGIKIGVITPEGRGYAGKHASGKATGASGSQQGALAGLIAYHNQAAKTPAQQDGSYAGDAGQGVDLAGSLPVTTPASSSSDGPRVTSAGGAGQSPAAGGSPAGLSPYGLSVYRRLLAKKMKPAVALAFARRADAMHDKAAGPKASAA
jgi:hypothetical protein